MEQSDCGNLKMDSIKDEIAASALKNTFSALPRNDGKD